jgi:hypothetical protein
MTAGHQNQPVTKKVERLDRSTLPAPLSSSTDPFFHPLLFPSASIRTRPPWKEQILDHKVTGVFFSKKTQTRQGNLQGSWKQPEKGTSNNSPLCKKPDLVSYMQGLSRNKKPDLVSYM